MKQLIYRSALLLLFVFTITAVVGSSRSNACDNKWMIKHTSLKPAPKKAVDPPARDFLFEFSFFQI